MDILKSVGSLVFGVVVFIGLILGLILLITFGASMASVIAPFVYGLAGVLFALNIVTLLAAIIPSARAVAGVVLFVSSYVYGLATWIYGLAVTLSLWGVIAVIVGILLGGVGVVPIGMLAAIFNGEWGILFILLAMIVLTWGTRFVAALILGSSENRHEQNNVIDVEPTEDSRTWGDLE